MEEERNVLDEVGSTLMASLDEIGLWEMGTKEREQAVKEYCQIADSYQKLQSVNLEYCSQMERLKVEKDKTKETSEIERKKLEIPKWKVALDVAKVAIVPLSWMAYGYYQKRILKFEETGRLTTTASKEFHLPNVFNWK